MNEWIYHYTVELLNTSDIRWDIRLYHFLWGSIDKAVLNYWSISTIALLNTSDIGWDVSTSFEAQLTLIAADHFKCNWHWCIVLDHPIHQNYMSGPLCSLIDRQQSD